MKLSISMLEVARQGIRMPFRYRWSVADSVPVADIDSLLQASALNGFRSKQKSTSATAIITTMRDSRCGRSSNNPRVDDETRASHAAATLVLLPTCRRYVLSSLQEEREREADNITIGAGSIPRAGAVKSDAQDEDGGTLQIQRKLEFVCSSVACRLNFLMTYVSSVSIANIRSLMTSAGVLCSLSLSLRASRISLNVHAVQG